VSSAFVFQYEFAGVRFVSVRCAPEEARVVLRLSASLHHCSLSRVWKRCMLWIFG